MSKQPHYSGSKKQTTRRSESKGKSHKKGIALHRAARRDEVSKEKTSGYGWAGHEGKSRWRAHMRRDESSKPTDAQRARSFKKGD